MRVIKLGVAGCGRGWYRPGSPGAVQFPDDSRAVRPTLVSPQTSVIAPVTMLIGLVRDSVLQCFCHTCRAPVLPAGSMREWSPGAAGAGACFCVAILQTATPTPPLRRQLPFDSSDYKFSFSCLLFVFIFVIYRGFSQVTFIVAIGISFAT